MSLLIPRMERSAGEGLVGYILRTLVRYIHLPLPALIERMD